MNMIRRDQPLYEADGYSWYMEQARLIREGRLDEADLENIAEELESMGRTEAHKLWSMLRLIQLHLLRWAYQPKRRTRSWLATIVRERINLAEHLNDNPSLKTRLGVVYLRAYAAARKEAAAETGLPPDTFPDAPPFTLDQVMQDGWMPDGGDGAR